MATDNGWIKVFRHILKDRGLWLINEPYDSRSAYLYLVLNAQYKDSTITGRYTKRAITIPEGALIRSLQDLSKEWAWSIGKTRRFLSRLSDIGAVTVTSTRDGTLITLVNYGKTEDERHTSEHTNEHDVEHDHRHGHEHGGRQGVEHGGGIHNKKDKNSKDIVKKDKELKKGATPGLKSFWENPE